MTEHKNYYHYYLCDNGAIIRIQAYRKPSHRTEPKSGSWIVFEFVNGFWQMPAFPEITMRKIGQLAYIGKISTLAESILLNKGKS